MQMKKLISAVATLGTMAIGPAFATPISGTSVQTQLTAAGAVINVNTDQYSMDEKWTLGATGAASALIMFELAGFADQNTFGIYDIYDPTKKLTIFNGPDGSGAQRLLSLSASNEFCSGTFASHACQTFSSDVFGFYLSTPQLRTYYSESGRNSDGVDHMVAFQGGDTRGTLNGRPWLANEFVLAWEDLYGGGDRDYNDFAVAVESVSSVPEPTGLALFGVGLVVLGMGTRLRKTTAHMPVA